VAGPMTSSAALEGYGRDATKIGLPIFGYCVPKSAIADLGAGALRCSPCSRLRVTDRGGRFTLVRNRERGDYRMPNGSSDNPHVYRSKFTLASKPGYWTTSFTADNANPYIEMDLSVTLNGTAVTRFWPYAIKVNGRNFAFDFQDYGEPLFAGPGQAIELKCTLFYKS